MALKFGGTTADFVRGSAPAVTSPPFTIAVMVHPRVTPSSTVTIGGLQDADKFSDSYLLRITSGAKFRFTVRDGTDIHSDTANNVTAGQWGLGVARCINASTRHSIWNADFANQGSNGAAATVNAAGIDRISYGKRDNAANDQPFDGSIFYAAIWDTDLSNSEIAALNRGLSPLFIRRSNLVSFLAAFWRNWQCRGTDWGISSNGKWRDS